MTIPIAPTPAPPRAPGRTRHAHTPGGAGPPAEHYGDPHGPGQAILADVHLGDVLVLPDGREMTVRSKVALPAPLGSVAGFVLCGELEALVATPATVEGPFVLYTPVDGIPDIVHRAHPVYSGACSYWAPHLPAQRHAMGELLYRVAELRGSIDPIVIVWRSREPVIFLRHELLPPGSLSVLYMSRDNEDTSAVARHASRVDVPIVVPDPVPLYERFTRVPV